MKERKILVLFYSFTGATATLAREVAAGALTVAGTAVEVKRVPELLSQKFFQENPDMAKIQKSLAKEFPEATVDDLLHADGVAFGTPVHFGSFASQLKQFIDQLLPVWLKGQLVNKPAALFCSAGSVHGGEELTLMSLIVPLLNLGMIPVGIPYPIQGSGPEFDAGSPYGAIYVTGHKGDRPLSEGDKKIARLLGARLATMTQILQCGCESCNLCQTLTRQEQ